MKYQYLYKKGQEGPKPYNETEKPLAICKGPPGHQPLKTFLQQKEQSRGTTTKPKEKLGATEVGRRRASERAIPPPPPSPPPSSRDHGHGHLQVALGLPRRLLPQDLHLPQGLLHRYISIRHLARTVYCSRLYLVIRAACVPGSRVVGLGAARSCPPAARFGEI
jgi:hypothetical protein